MTRYLIGLLLLFLLTACGGKRKALTVTVPPSEEGNPNNASEETEITETTSEGITGYEKDVKEVEVAVSEEARNIIQTAMSYNGTPYRYGGTTRKGMDCSGLIYTCFLDADISLNRSSAAMATQGKEIPLRKVAKGDLLFFTTGNNRRRINHVGLVVETEGDEIQFIHATTSRGVLISSLREGYWNRAFHHARRIL